jgi:hypothetical protein
MQITIQATSSADLRAQIFELAKLVGFDDKAEIQGEFNYPKPTEMVLAEPVTEKTTKTRGRPKKTDEETSEIQVSDLGKTYAKSDVDTALKEVMDKKGIPAVRTILTSFGYSRVSDIPTDRYSSFITHCKEATDE